MFCGGGGFLYSPAQHQSYNCPDIFYGGVERKVQCDITPKTWKGRQVRNHGAVNGNIINIFYASFFPTAVCVSCLKKMTQDCSFHQKDTQSICFTTALTRCNGQRKPLSVSHFQPFSWEQEQDVVNSQDYIVCTLCFFFTRGFSKLV